MKNKAQLDGMPVWFDGKSINEALFCEEFLQTHKIIFTNGAFFTPEGRVTDELPLRGEIFEELKCYRHPIQIFYCKTGYFKILNSQLIKTLPQRFLIFFTIKFSGFG